MGGQGGWVVYLHNLSLPLLLITVINDEPGVLWGFTRTPANTARKMPWDQPTGAG